MQENMTSLKEMFQKDMSEKDQKSFLKKLASCDQASDQIISWGGKLALENQEWDLAESFFSCLLERRSQPEDLIGLAKALFKNKAFKEAEECLIEAMNGISDPCNLLFIVYKNLGNIYLSLGNFSMCEEFYNKAYTLSPHSVSLKFHRALLDLKQKHYVLAESKFQDILVSEPQHENSWLGLSIVRRFLNEEELAKACLHRCLDLNPRHKEAQCLSEIWNSQPVQHSTHEFKFSA